MCLLLAQLIIGFFFLAADVYRTNEANKAGRTCCKAVYILRCLWPSHIIRLHRTVKVILPLRQRLRNKSFIRASTPSRCAGPRRRLCGRGWGRRRRGRSGTRKWPVDKGFGLKKGTSRGELKGCFGPSFQPRVKLFWLFHTIGFFHE
jgi:hypothetical protein